jgi:hypothetical protein
MNSPSQLCDEAARIVAHDEFARLVQAASKQVNAGMGKNSLKGNVHDQCQGKCHGNKEVSRGDIARLEGMMAERTEQRRKLSSEL